MALTKEQELRLKAEARLRLKRKQQEPQGAAPQEEGPGVLDRVGDFYKGYGNFIKKGAETGLRIGKLGAEGASRGIMEMIQLPGAALNQAPRLANLIPGVDNVGPIVEDYNPAMEAGRKLGLVGVTQPENTLERYIMEGGRAASGAALLGGGAALGMRGAQGTSMLGQAGKEIATTAASRPGLFIGSDAAGGFGAAAGGDAGSGVADWLGFDETGQQIGRGIGGLLGGTAAGVTPAVAPDAARRARDYASKQFLPFTKGGAMHRAGEQLQRQITSLDDPDARALIEQAANRVDKTPEGMTPARASQEPGLIAQERAIMEANPQLRRRITQQNDQLQTGTDEAIRAFAGKAQPKQQWTRNLLERVAPRGAKIQPGDTDDMLRQTYDSFGPAYRAFDGYQIDPRNLGRNVDLAIKDSSAFVSDDVRNTVRRWIDGELKGLGRRAVDRGALTSDDLIELRSNIRNRIRDTRASTSNNADETRKVLENTERAITEYIQEALPTPVRAAMRDIDNQYRQFKVVEDAAYRSGEGELDPKKVLDAIRRGSSSRGQYTRGDQAALRRQVIQGLDGEDLLKDPELLRRAVRGAPYQDRKPVISKLVNTMADRARTAPDESGYRALSGNALRAQLKENRQALLEAGMPDRAIKRLDKLTQRIVDVQRTTDQQVGGVLTDEISSFADLAAAVIGAKSGQHISGGGLGAALVMAQFMSNRARNLLASVFGSEAEQLLLDAATKPELYSALLRTSSASIPKQREAARVVEAWLLQNVADTTGVTEPIEE